MLVPTYESAVTVCRSGIIYVLFAFNSWLSPSFVVVFGPRISMLVAALLYVFYVSQYLYLNTYSVYVATALVGLAAPVIWTAQVGIFQLYKAQSLHWSDVSRDFCWPIILTQTQSREILEYSGP